jgi:hypothetical protein
MKSFRILTAAVVLLLGACAPAGPKKPRLCLFVGFDVSGSFLKSPNYGDAVEFLGRYLHAHMAGIDGLEVPDEVFVGAIGGEKKNDVKTLFPKQAFAGKSPEEISAKVREFFPKNAKDDYTDFNAFFTQVADTVKSKNLVLRPIAIVLLSDGVPAAGSDPKKPDYRAIKMNPLENLSRNVTVRILYTDAVTGKSWRDEVPRKRVKVWTQDAVVMKTSKDPAVWKDGVSVEEQDKFIAWVKDNVDFPVRAKRVD